jgi:endogenous inhibitor of DNA gyrase (YacG/DUF329 family)
MPKKRIPHLRCPSCRTIVLRTDEYYPFCSDRCRLIDLGKWASGAYKISSPILDPDVLQDISGISERGSSQQDDDSGPERKRNS